MGISILNSSTNKEGITFDPLSFHLPFCYFSPEYSKVNKGKKSAQKIFNDFLSHKDNFSKDSIEINNLNIHQISDKLKH